MEQASGHRQEAAVLKNQLAADQVTSIQQHPAARNICELTPALLALL